MIQQHEENKEIALADKFINYTGTNIFLTGKAGTGKTTFLKNIKKTSSKRMVVCAPTGVAAINAGGVTLHSFFQLSFGPQIQNATYDNEINKFRKEKINIIKSMDLLIIDEISMVRADTLDAIDKVLRRFRNKYLPFGGVQLLMIGDLQQLAPVVKDEEWAILSQYYETPYFFDSIALKETDYISIKLNKIYRQQDNTFIDILNKIRENNLDNDTLDILNERYVEDTKKDEYKNYITLTTHNKIADAENFRRLNMLEDKGKTFSALIEGNYPQYSYPTEENLLLKKGARVMFVKNDSIKNFYNGKTGSITEISGEKVTVSCDDGSIIDIEPTEWQNFEYSLNNETQEIEESVVGKFKQIPLKLAWAITIHKSQGLTFENAIIDANRAFAHGQIYVALSRCKTLEGIVFNSKINKRGLVSDENINNYLNAIENKQPDEKELREHIHKYELSLMSDLIDFKTLRFRLNQLVKVLITNKTLMPEKLLDSAIDLKNELNSKVIETSNVFLRQITSLHRECDTVKKNTKLQERIRKGCIYYLKCLEKFDSFFPQLKITLDNKKIKKDYNNASNLLLAEYNLKRACLESCKDNFEISIFLKTRASFSIEKKRTDLVKNGKDKIGFDENEDFDVQLFNLLKQWRDIKAKESGKPPYTFVQVKTMKIISATLPLNKKELSKIKGIGKKKMDDYGSEILGIVTDYCESQGIKKTKEP